MVPFDLNEIQALDQTDSTDFFVHALERITVLQGKSAEWLDQHNYRLTASNFGKLYFRVQRPSEAMLKNIFEAKDLTNVRAISHGKAKEKLSRTIYAKKCKSKYLVLQYLMLGYQFIHRSLTLEQVLMERCLIHLQIQNTGYSK